MSSRSTNPDMPSNLKLLKSLKTFFKRRHKILLAFLFGSFASNCSRPSSDVDIGILFETVPDIYVINGLTEELSSILQREADLVVLNHASPVLKMQILKNGILLYASNRNISTNSLPTR